MCTAEILSLDKEKLERCDVIGSMDALPFQDNTFDTVICIDAIEHVPYAKRKSVYMELKRIAKFRVVLHHPIQDHCQFKGRVCDFWLNHWHQTVYGCNERNTQEHLRNVEPSFIELRKEGFRILGLLDAETWIKLMYFQFLKAKPFGIILAWIYKYARRLRDAYARRAHAPAPKYFYGGLSIYDKLSSDIMQVLKESREFSS